LWNEEGSNSKLVVVGRGHSKEIVLHQEDPMWGPFSHHAIPHNSITTYNPFFPLLLLFS